MPGKEFPLFASVFIHNISTDSIIPFNRWIPVESHVHPDLARALKKNGENTNHIFLLLFQKLRGMTLD
jgi:hypothetical protein